MICRSLLIFYVKDQHRAASFYRFVLDREPVLDVPGMTEFELGGGAVLGLMPEEGISRLLGDGLPHPRLAEGVPRAELYLSLERGEVSSYHERAIKSGAIELSSFRARDWGESVAYSRDLDGHVLAFGEPTLL